jgi:4-hydroxyphenylpyruvate dioxygenase
MNQLSPLDQPVAAGADAFPLQGIDHIELYVGNARQAALFYRALGFRPVAYAGLETGLRTHTSWVVEQGDVRLVLTGALGADSPIAEHVRLHGDSVRDVALRVPDSAAAWQLATSRGAISVTEPHVREDEFGRVVVSSVQAYGDTIHSFVERGGYEGVFAPGFVEHESDARDVPDVGVEEIDHVVASVELGRMDELVGYYARVMGFEQLHHFDDEQISTDYSALMNKVMWDGAGRVRFPVCEPAEGKRKSQIEEFLDYHGGPGVQHIALTTSDIVATTDEMRARGIEFLRVPDSYYDEVAARVPAIAERVDDLRRAGILADRDDEGYLLQTFAKSAHDRPTLFYEVIERQGSRGFGGGNIKALFEALEREQDSRGNL